jgi:hypothetical protein
MLRVPESESQRLQRKTRLIIRESRKRIEALTRAQEQSARDLAAAKKDLQDAKEYLAELKVLDKAI